MITLDYRTNNPYWGKSGVHFNSWEDLALSLGFLSNPKNHKISIHIESNDNQGAWGKEGRIHYYHSLPYLQSNLKCLYDCRSAGNGNITCRINSNNFIYSLIHDFGFTTSSQATAIVTPPQNNQSILNILISHLNDIGESQKTISNCVNQFNLGNTL